MSTGLLQYINDRRKAPTKIVNLIAGIGTALCVLSVYCIAQIPLTTRIDPSYEVVVEKNILVPVRDGVRLALDLYRPARNGNPVSERFPTLLVRTPYDKSGGSSDGEYFASRGYVVAINDTRGRFQSEGKWRMMVDDPTDGYDIVEWIARQPWSNGKVGTMGGSYVGGTQHALACLSPPHLTTMIPSDALSNCGVAGMRHSGAFELRFMNWIFSIGAPNSQAALKDPTVKAALAKNAELMSQHVWNLPIKKGTTALKFAPEYEDFLIDAMSHGDNDAYWKQPGFSVVDNVKGYADVPVYHVTGWYDSWTRQVTMNYEALSPRKKSLHRLIIGPWTHGGQGNAFAGEIEFPADAALDFNAWRLRWFDRWMKGVDNGSDKEPPILLFVMGGGSGKKSSSGRVEHGGRWRAEKEWPLARTRFTPYYLHSDGTLGITKQVVGSDPLVFRFDPAKPVPTIGGNISSATGLMENGGWDQRCREGVIGCSGNLPLAERNDILVFQTLPLESDIEVTGPVQVRLWASSSAVDTDFTAKLIDVYPPNGDYPSGFELNIGDSIIRARYRDSLEKPSLLKPGEPYRFTITLYPTSNVFKRGHQIRLDISSSNFPRFDINPNTGEPLQRHRRLQIAENTIYLDSHHSSQILLPVIP
jgi:putative CocE/NonD family hydrolase